VAADRAGHVDASTCCAGLRRSIVWRPIRRGAGLELTSDTPNPSIWKRFSPFQFFKFALFSILMVNLFVYLKEDVTAYLYLDPGASLGAAMEAFAVTIDYAAWMVLIVLFEYETSVLAKGHTHGARKWVFSALTAMCYVVLVYAAYGYAVAAYEFYDYAPIDSETVCGLAENNYAYMNEQARPIELTRENCAGFSDQQVFKSPTDHLIATQSSLIANQKLGWVGIANASAWLIVVLIFQVEIMLQQADKLTKRWLTFCTTTKVLMYLILAVNAIYWTIYSAFIDSWDAWLWLVAFVLIDLNLLGWEDTTESHPTAELAPAD
jgi:hypothetical protein